MESNSSTGVGNLSLVDIKLYAISLGRPDFQGAHKKERRPSGKMTESRKSNVTCRRFALELLVDLM